MGLGENTNEKAKMTSLLWKNKKTKSTHTKKKKTSEEKWSLVRVSGGGSHRGGVLLCA